MADLETEVETPPPPPETPPAPAADPPPPPPAEADPEGTVEVGGQKLAPVGAVIAERRERQALERKLNEQQAAIQQLQPYVQFIAANQHLFTQQGQPAPAPAPSAPDADPEAVELARTLDLYTPDGKPDAARALKLVTLVDRRAQHHAESAIRPMEDTTARERAGYMYQRALVTKATDGRMPDPQILQRLWTQTDPRISGTEEGAAGLVAMAIGLQALTNQAAPPPAPPANAPLITETSGGRPGHRTALTSLDQGIIKMRGVKPETYAELTRGFNPGVSNVLED